MTGRKGVKTMGNKYANLKNALERAKETAEVYVNTEDGGTCNFDSPAIDYRSMQMIKSKAIEAIQNAGLRCFEWKCYGSNLLVVCGIGKGQGNRRTRMSEAACQSLKNDKIAACMYYQMD